MNRTLFMLRMEFNTDTCLLGFMIRNEHVTLYQVSFDITILYVLTYIIAHGAKILLISIN